MAKSDKDKVTIGEISSLADAFDAAWNNKEGEIQPPGSITANQYAKKIGLSYFTARRRLEELVDRGLATKSDETINRNYCYFLED
jgi:Fic family protein